MPEQLDSFATATDMSDRTQGQVTAASHPFLERELEAATQDIRDFCGWHIAPARQVEYRRTGRLPDDVWLPAMEVQSIDSVTIDGTAWTDVAVQRVEFDRDTGWTNLTGRSVIVKYTAGFKKTPPNLLTATLEMAAAALGTSMGWTREQAAGVSVDYGRAGGGIDPDSPGGRRLAAYRIGRLP
ncbi:hypothetical protein K8F61_17125 [Microbacterium resistens]|uniref:Head-to-tail adaptor n=1 Tax=Microbacterium resistens TaxID=156977 RepID=A0ABY3RQK5_9MICO|nr:hypothetical protein [Microbacterium resistens]UGS26327.1 hypothetical protein K8F61_17125 [Microbacterium resistens]